LGVPIARDSAVTPASACRLGSAGPVFASGGHTSPVEPAPALHVVGHVGQCHGSARPGEADGTDHQPHDPLLMREGMLDMRAHRGFGRVRPRMVPRPRPMPARYRSFSADRYAVSAQTSEAVLFGSISPSRSRAPSWAAASVVFHAGSPRAGGRSRYATCSRRPGRRCRYAACRQRRVSPC